MPVSAPIMVSKGSLSRPAFRRGVALRCLAAAMCSSVMLFLAYFPANQGWLAWFALVPGLVLVRADLRSRDRYLISWIAALLFFVPALSWMRVAHDAMFYSWLALSLYCSWFGPPAIWLVRRLDRRGLPLALSVPVVWTALEFLRTYLLGGFPWYFLGHSQHEFLAVIQIADLGGVSAVTFLVAMVNGVLAESLLARPRIQNWFGTDARRPRLRLQFGAVAIAAAAVLAYGGWRLSQDHFSEGPFVALLQTDVGQDVRNARPDDSGGGPDVFEEIHRQNVELTKRTRQLPRKPDLIIWPETTFEYDYKKPRDPAPADEEYRPWAEDIANRQALFEEVAAASQTTVLLGINSQEYVGPTKIQRFNSALLIDPTGKVAARYDKTHLVPFGEYVPLYETLPFLRKLAPYADNELTMLTPGVQFPRISFTAQGKTYSFGCMICYEDSYADIARRYLTGKDGPVDILVNQSNDGWFKRTQEHEQHLAVSRFRAIECRRALVRAVNMGISAVIDGNGRMVATPGPTWSQSKGVMTVVSASVPLDTRASFYAGVGDWLAWGCCIGLVAGVVRRRKDGAV